MGTVIAFPDTWRQAPAGARSDGQGEPATIIILPVIRVERHGDNPSGDTESGSHSPGRRRRRRASR
jgi:hypothetical protein